MQGDSGTKERSVYVTPLNALLIVAEQYGADRQDMLDQAGIDPGLMAALDNRVPVAQYFRLYGIAETLTGNPDLALHSGRLNFLTGLNLQLFMTGICTRFRDYLNLMPSVLKIWGDIGEVKIQADGDFIRLEWHPLDPATGAQRFLSDEMLAASAAIVDSICILPVPVRRACFTYRRPACTRMLEQTFCDDLGFEAPVSCLYFERSVLNYPLVKQNYALPSGASIPFASLFDGVDPADRFWSGLRQAIVRRLPLGDVSIEAVAADINSSKRTLQRRLQARSTRFQQVVADLRAELAGRYLADADTSITEIAFMLGYSDQAAFSNAFKRRNGMSPSNYRRRNAPSTGA